MENQIKKALIIKSIPIDKILAGTKTWEMRSTPTKTRGRIGLIKSKSGKIWGQANLVDGGFVTDATHTGGVAILGKDGDTLIGRFSFDLVSGAGQLSFTDGAFRLPQR